MSAVDRILALRHPLRFPWVLWEVVTGRDSPQYWPLGRYTYRPVAALGFVFHSVASLGHARSCWSQALFASGALGFLFTMTRYSSRLLCCVLLWLGGVVTAQAPDLLYDKTRLLDLHFTFAQSNWWNQLLNSHQTSTPIKAALQVDGVTYTDVGIHMKGYSSSWVTTKKKPFNLVMDAFQPGQTLYGYKTINLNNAYLDPTFTREVLTYELMENYLPVPQTAFARVYLNGTYWGVYILVEQPNKDFLRRHYRDEDGHRFKGDPPSGPAVDASTFEYRGSAPSVNHPHYILKSPDQQAWTDLVDLTYKLNRSSSVNLRRNVGQVVNVDRALWYFATHTVIHNLDCYISGGRNFYCYIDPDTGLLNMIPWDANMAFGSFNGGLGAWSHSLLFNATASRRPLLSVLLGVGAWKQRYFAHVRTILDESYKWDAVMKTNNDRYQTMIDAAVRADPNRQYPYSYFRDNLTKNLDGRSGFGILPGMKTLVDQRRQYLLGDVQIKKPTPSVTAVRFPASVTTPGQPVWVTAKVTASAGVKKVTLHTTDLPHATFAISPMYDDGKHHDGLAGDGVYGGSFLAAEAFEEKRFYVRGTASNFTVQFHPRRPEYEPFVLRTVPSQPAGPLVINELLADNDQGDVDEKGENEDWVELLNTGSVAYDLSGHYLSDDIHEPKQWPFPAGTSIPAGGFLRIWCDNEPGDGPLHATFKLSDEGEELFLVDTDARGNKVLDGILFADQSSDRSFGSVPDASAEAFYVWTPSGGQPVTGSGLGQAVRFDLRRRANPSGMDLKTKSVPRVGRALDLEVEGGAPMATGVLGVSLGVTHIGLGVLGPLLLDPAVLVLAPLALDASGNGHLVTPALPANTLGLTVYAQALVGDFTNALAIRISQ
jgi:hypothetical protein